MLTGRGDGAKRPALKFARRDKDSHPAVHSGFMATCRIALANLQIPSSPDESVTLAARAVAEAGAGRAQVICFPECYVPGYRAGTNAAAPLESWLEGAWATIGRAAASAGIVVALGTERAVGDARRITVLVIGEDGEPIGFQDKVQLDPSEDDLFEPGAGRPVFHAGPLTFGVAICHEGWRYPETVRSAARLGAQLVFHPHFHVAEPGGYRPESFGDPRNTFHESAVRCRAAENTCYVASVNCASDGSPTTSAVANPDGSLLCHQPYGEAGVLFAELDLSAATGLLARRFREA